MTIPPLSMSPQPDPEQQPGPYDGQPSPALPTAYAGILAGYGPADPVRPAVVTTAAILACIWGGLTMVSSLISMAAGTLFSSVGSACAENDQSGLCAFAAGSRSLLIVVGIALIVSAGLVVWGGVAALSGKNAKVLVMASGIQIAIQIVWMIDTGSIAFGIVGVSVPLCIIMLILSAASKSWFQAKRGATY